MVKRTVVKRRQRRRPSKAALEILSTNLRMLRALHQYSQLALSDIAGVHPSYVGDLERGEQNPTLSTLELLADAFGISISELLREQPKPQPVRKRR